VTLRVKKSPGAASLSSGGVHKIYFGVQDTGVGISKDAQKNLFNPFAQADSSVTRKFGGTGLGLAISQRLIEAMGGKIQIDSIEGEGSTFHFTVMLEEGSAEAAEDSSTKPLRMQKSEKSLKILIVEDNEINQRLLKEFVNRMGHETTLAGTGEIAIELIKSNSFDMVLMDVELPGLSGMGATKAIRAMEDRQKAMLPVIALTGNVRSEDVRQCYAANMNGHLAKPVDPKRLKQMIDKVISNTLDNPVVLEDKAEETYTKVNRLDKESIASRVKSKVEGEQPESEETAIVSEDDRVEEAADVGFKAEEEMEESQVIAGDPVKAVPTYKSPAEIGAVDEIAPIRRLAMQAQEMAFEPSDDDSPFSLPPQGGKEKGPGGSGKGMSFDESSLSVLRRSMDDSSFGGLIDDLFSKSDEIIDAIRGHAQTNRISEIRARAHELKGMAGNYGLRELSELAASIEVAAKEGRIGTINDLHKTLPGVNIRAREAVDQWMAGS
ncbi:MAG: response regulator, partial [Proteobacteria bacterium]|nr:response regulator [Pseudomonadota bacterium]